MFGPIFYNTYISWDIRRPVHFIVGKDNFFGEISVNGAMSTYKSYRQVVGEISKIPDFFYVPGLIQVDIDLLYYYKFQPILTLSQIHFSDMVKIYKNESSRDIILYDAITNVYLC